MVQIFLEHSASAVGLSRAQILLIILVIVFALALIIAFILVTISAWQNESSFNAVIQSLMISGSGKAAVMFRSRSSAEADENVSKTVANLISAQEDANEEG